MATKHVISVSGGKDSTAVLLLALERCPPGSVIPIFCDTGNEHAAVYAYLDYLEQAMGVTIDRLRADFSRQLAAKRMFIARDARTGRDRAGRRLRWSNKAKRRALAVMHPSGNPFLDLCMWKGRFPARMAQFCTEELKRNMAVGFQMDLMDAGHCVISWQGVRRDESQRRRNAKKSERVAPRLRIFRPIVDWTAAQVFDLAASRRVQPNPLYLQGMGRVGCMPCINCGKDELRQIAVRWPEHIERIAEWERIVSACSKRGGSTFMTDAHTGQDRRQVFADLNVWSRIVGQDHARRPAVRPPRRPGRTHCLRIGLRPVRVTIPQSRPALPRAVFLPKGPPPMKRDNFTMPLAFPGELIIDNFAGGGGTSTGLEAAFGRPVDIAINHDPEALAMHAANHPHTLHLCESVWDVNPIQVTGNQPVALVWLSPDCKHFSKAKGGTPVSKHIRGLAWVGMRWVAMCKPRVLMLENVEEFQTWGPILVGPDDQARPDPARRGKTFQSFVRQLKAHGYQVDWRELRASDHGTPTIRKRLFLVARRDGLPIVWPEQTHAEPTDRRVIAGKLAAHRTAAECIDFDLPAESVFGRRRPLVDNTMRRVAKGLWRHVLTSASPFIVGAGGPVYSGRPTATDRPIGTVTTQNHRAVAQPVMAPYLNEHANASNQRTMPVDAPLRTICAQVKGGHFSVVAPTLAPLRGTSEQHLVGHAVDAPLSTVAASGTHQALVGANLVTIGYGEREGQKPRAQDIAAPLGTVVAGGIKSALVAAHLVDMGHGEGPAGGKRFSHGIRSLEVPLNTVTASGGTSALAAVHLTHLTHHGERTGNDPREPLRTVTGANRGEQAMVAACLEQANGGFYDGDGRPVGDPMSTITSSGTQQRLITAYMVKYYSEGGQDSACSEPMHTVPTKARMGLVQTCQVPAATLAPEHAERARLCAELLHKHLPEHFPDPAELVLMWHAGQWWVLVDITLRMLKPRELFRAQGFPEGYQFERVPDPALLFRGGKQAADPRDVPLIDLSTTAQVRMCGNSVCPPLAEALARANFAHEALIYGVAA